MPKFARFLLPLCLLSLGLATPARAKPPYKVWGYVMAGDVDPRTGAPINYALLPWADLTNVMDAFALPNASAGLNMASANGVTLVALAHANQVRCNLSVGGSTASLANFAADTNATNRAKFVASITQTVATDGYDGVDIDWEFPTAAQKTTNFMPFMQALYAAVKALPACAIDGQPHELTFFISAGGSICGVDWSSIGNYCDSGIMSGYDYFIDVYNGPLAGEAPYTDCANTSATGDIVGTYGKIHAAGMPADKLSLGCPLYGNLLSSGNEVEIINILQNGTPGAYQTAQAEQLYGYSGDQTTADTAQSFCDKINWALAQGMQGIGLWELAQAYPPTDPLVAPIWATIGGSNGCLALPTSSPSPSPAPVTPSATATKTPMAPSATPTATRTPVPATGTPTATRTPVPATATPTATVTWTLVPPTATPTQTLASSTATPTATPPASTATATALAATATSTVTPPASTATATALAATATSTATPPASTATATALVATATPTATPPASTATATALVATATPTATPPASTATATALAATATPTVTPPASTATATALAATATPTVTPPASTATATALAATATPTVTPPASTATATALAATATATPTATPPAGTATATALAATATPTSAVVGPASPNGPPRVDQGAACPNPETRGSWTFALKLSDPADHLEARVYTPALVLAQRVSLDGAWPRDWTTVRFDVALPPGLYYVVVRSSRVGVCGGDSPVMKVWVLP